METIAEVHLIAISSDSTPMPVCLRIGRPEPRSEGDWICAAHGEGLRHWQGPTEFFGVGSWHALTIALRFLRELLETEMSKGTTFQREGDAINLDDLFLIGEIKEPTDS